MADAAGLYANLPANCAGGDAVACRRAHSRCSGPSGCTWPALGYRSAERCGYAATRPGAAPNNTHRKGPSTTTALASRMLLGYPDDTGSARGPTQAIVVGLDTATGEALARVRGNPGLGETKYTWWMKAKRLQGMVGLQVLLRAHETMSLAGADASRLPAYCRSPCRSPEPPLIRPGNRPTSCRSSNVAIDLSACPHAAKLAETLSRGHSGHTDTPDETLSGMLARGYWEAAGPSARRPGRPASSATRTAGGQINTANLNAVAPNRRYLLDFPYLG